MPRTIAYRLYIAWDGTNYVAESARLLQASGENRLTSPDAIGSGRGIVDRCTLELDNRDGRYSPLNSGGALYANIQSGGAYNRPMYLEVSIDGGTSYTVTLDDGFLELEVEMKKVAGNNQRFAASIKLRQV